MNRSHKQEINAPFRAKSAGVSLIAVLTIGLYYFATAISLLPSDKVVPDGALGLAITAVVLLAVVEAALQIVLFIGAGRIEERTERDDAIAAQSSRNAYVVMTAGVFAAYGSMFVGLTAFQIGSVILLAFLLAETVKFASQLVYYRRSA
jgi:hypothetical protein